MLVPLADAGSEVPSLWHAPQLSFPGFGALSPCDCIWSVACGCLVPELAGEQTDGEQRTPELGMGAPRGAWTRKSRIMSS